MLKYDPVGEFGLLSLDFYLGTLVGRKEDEDGDT